MGDCSSDDFYFWPWTSCCSQSQGWNDWSRYKRRLQQDCWNNRTGTARCPKFQGGEQPLLMGDGVREIETDDPKHDGPHDGTFADTCFGCRLKTLQFQGMAAQARRDKDSSLDKDLGAYKSMRAQGVQPKHVFGSYEVQQQAGTKFEAENQTIMSPELRKEFASRLPNAK